MPQTLFILGRTPALSLAEILAVFPQANVVACGRDFAVVDGVSPKEIDLKRIGGIVKVGEILADSDRLHFEGAAELLRGRYAGGARLTFGASLHGGKPGMLKTLLIGVKKALKETEITSRFINHDFNNLTSAQSGLAKLPEAGMELLVATDGAKRWWYATTTAVQPFDDYRRRDYEKAVRDARVGMLPPKLAQMMVNVGVGTVRDVQNVRVVRDEHVNQTTRTSETVEQFEQSAAAEIEQVPRSNALVYDPFCGTGTVLAEAALLGHTVVGSDLDPRMAEATRKNLAALNLTGQVFAHNAKIPLYNPTFDVPNAIVVTEGYLGPALSRLPPPPVRTRVFGELAALYSSFFTALPARVVVLTLPAYVEDGVPKYFSSTFLAPEIEKAGWQKVDVLARLSAADHVAFTSKAALTYFRPDQIVAREVTVWVRR